MGHYLTLIFSPRITRIYTDLLDIQIDKYERYAETFFRPDGLLLYPISAIRFLRPRRLKMVMELSSFKILRVLRISFRVDPLVVMSGSAVVGMVALMATESFLFIIGVLIFAGITALLIGATISFTVCVWEDEL